MKATQNSLRNSLEQVLEKHKVTESEKRNSLRSQIVNSIKKEFLNWCSEGQVLTLGSYKLGVHSPDSDIDLLCVAPVRYSREEFQQEFFTRLESMDDVTYCFGIFRAKVPIIKMIINQISIDIQFANCDQDIKSETLLNLDEPSLLGINAYKICEFILSIVPNIENFQGLCRVIKLWAKQRNLYSGLNGYLSGISWTILCAKICTIYPNLSIPDLTQKFFKIFSLWDWSIPVSINPSEFSYLSSPYNTLMTIMTPIYPSYNTAYTLIPSAFALIVTELELASKIVKDIVEGYQEWQSLLEELDFFQQYRYFIKIAISAYGENEYETWSGLVFSRVKYLLMELERGYPRPVVNFYNKGFERTHKNFKCSKQYFIGLRFNFQESVKIDLRSPIQNFCRILNEIQPNKDSMQLQVVFLNRKDLISGPGKQILKS